MNIRLKETIHPELKSLGLKAGDIIRTATIGSKVTGCLHFTYGNRNCSIWPEDYELIPNQTQTIEAAYLVGFEPSEESSQNNELMFIEAQEYLTNEAIRY